jgi:hypothetical protein
MVYAAFSGTLIFSHIIPAILGFLGVLLIISGIMDENRSYTLIGIILFFSAAILPFLILSLIIGS